MNEAIYDLEGQAARPATALRPGPYGPVAAAAVLALGAVGAVPPRLDGCQRNPLACLLGRWDAVIVRLMAALLI